MLTLVAHDWRPVEVDLVVNDKKWIVIVNHIVIDAHTVKVLLQQVLEEEIFLLESCLLLFDRKLV